MAVKITKGQICSGTISKIKCHKEYYLICGKFHTFITNSTECLIFWTMPLYYLSEWYLNHRITITLHDSIIRKSNKTVYLSSYNVMENSKKVFL